MRISQCPLSVGTDPLHKFRRREQVLTVGQNPNGSLWVSNTDPALTGKTVLVFAETKEGKSMEVWITVPPPKP